MLGQSHIGRPWQRWTLRASLLILDLNRMPVVCPSECPGRKRLENAWGRGWFRVTAGLWIAECLLRALPWADTCLSMLVHMGASAGPASPGWQNHYPAVDLTLIIGTHGNATSILALDPHPAEVMALGPAGFPENRHPRFSSLRTQGQQQNSNTLSGCGFVHGIPALC